MSEFGVSTSKWDAAEYARVGSFVTKLGAAALDLLDPRPGERILDVGCGEGTLTRAIAERGATVIGIDHSPDMIAAAQANGVDAVLLDVASMTFDDEFDAVFSNAAMHWVLEKQRAAQAIFRALKPGGRFAGEMGGEGNVLRLRTLIDEEMVIRGYMPPAGAENWYPSAADFADIYEVAGFEQIDARLIDRPTPVPHGIAAWVLTFRTGWFDRAQVPEEERPEIAKAIEERFGPNPADYVRLRFIMRKPN